MAAFLFTFVIVTLVSLGGRDQLLIARLAHSLGSNAGLLAAGALASVASAALMAWAGNWLANVLPAPAATMLVALALLLAAGELAWPVKTAAPREPTRSFAAIAIVLLARQIGDAARFVIFAIAAALPATTLAAAGGALAGVGAVALGWALGISLPERFPLRRLRVGTAAVLLVAAVTLAMRARGIIG